MELWDAYYPDGTKAGVDLVRGEPILPQFRHAVTEVLVLHQDGTMLLMQRDFRKPNAPGNWESSAGGSVLKGEDFLTGAKRELLEETGIEADRLEYLYQDVTKDTIYQGYLCITDVPKDSVRLQEGETIAYRWVTPEEFWPIANGTHYTSNSRGQLDHFLYTEFFHQAPPISLPLLALQPSQFYISEAKLNGVLSWFDPKDLQNFQPLPVKQLNGAYVLTDGHTRAYAAYLTGLSQVPLRLDTDELDWDAYRLCVEACRKRCVTSIADLQGRVLTEDAYQRQWLGWCKQLHTKLTSHKRLDKK